MFTNKTKDINYVRSGCFYLCLVLVLGLTSTSVRAELSEKMSENLGTFSFSEFSLEPTIHLQEESGNAFLLQSSYLGFEWRRDENLRGEFWLGSSDMVQSAVWFSPSSNPAFGVVEAFLEQRSSIGDFRAGLVNVQMGYEGSVPESAWALPPTHFHQQGWMINRDFGVQFEFSTYPFTTMATISNGESTMNNPDSQFWYSALWRLKNSQGFGALVTAQVGNTTALSTGGATPSLAASKYSFVFDPSSDAKIRVGSLSLFQDNGKSLYLIEAGSGDIIQNGVKNSFGFGHVDIAYRLASNWQLLLRYEQDQADLDNDATMIKSVSLGFKVDSKDKLQSMTLFATHNDETPEIQNDELLLLFRLNSRTMD